MIVAVLPAAAVDDDYHYRYDAALVVGVHHDVGDGALSIPRCLNEEVLRRIIDV